MSSRSRRFDRFVPLVYLALSFVMLLPFSAQIGRALPGPRVDTFQNLWNFWWVKKAITELGRAPFYTMDLLHPWGADLSFHTLSLANTIWAVPFGHLSPVTLLGLTLFLAFPLAAWGMYLLAMELVNHRAAAFLAGFAYAFFPHHLDQIYSHLNLTSHQFLPFYLLALIRLVRAPSIKQVVIASLFLAVQTYACWTYMMHALLLGALVVIVLGGRHRDAATPPARGHLFAMYVRHIGLFLILIAPILMPALAARGESGAFQYKAIRPNHSASIETIVSPSVFHPVFGEGVRAGNPDYAHLPRGATAYLGFAMLALALLGLTMRDKRGASTGADRARDTTSGFTPFERRFFFAMGTGFLILALGPKLQFSIGEETGVPLPYAILQQIPVLRFLRVPNRFLIPGILFLAPLVAAGFAALRRRGGFAPRAGALALAAVLVFEYCPPPISTMPWGKPAWADRLLARKHTGAVLDVPLFLGSQATIYMWYQTLHERPLVSGYVSIPPPTFGKIREEGAFFEWITEKGRDLRLGPPPEMDPRARFAELGIGDIVLHKDFDANETRHAPPGMTWPEESDGGQWYWKYTTVTGSIPHGRMQQYRRVLEEWCGAPYYEDDRVALFAVE
ncbi:MAG: hypothetical protein HKN20_12555 [Gemmatimonadetes bacterium]|nr:hypothetical protein [Gemmatimonadota bacterium]